MNCPVLERFYNYGYCMSEKQRQELKELYNVMC